MNQGRLVQIGTPGEIYERPVSRFVADFVGEVNLFEGELTTRSNGPALAVAGFGIPIPLPPGTKLHEGAAATLAVRPELLVLTNSSPEGFAIPAKVSSIAYLGGGSIVHLRTGEGRALKAYLPGTAAGAFGRGTEVWASWPPEKGVVLPQ
jgi:ABC-type Fe3+/spermidine/putrescine transport system ATPase subunit